MRNLLSASGSPALLRLSVVALLGGSAAACSSDVNRFQDPNGSPFAANQASPAYTGSVAAAPTSAVQSSPIASAPMAPPTVASNYPGPYGAPAAAAPYGAPQHVAMATPAQQPLYGTQPRPLATPAPVAAAAVHAPQVAAAAPAGGHVVVTSGQTLSSISRTYGIPRNTLAAANGLDPNASVKIGQKLTLPGVVGATTAVAAAAPKVAPAVAAAATKPVTTAQAAVAPVAAATKPVVAAATPAVEPKAQTIAAVKASETPDDARVADAGVQFRWPVRGRVISGFGPKPGGQQNEGINVSVPEGTSVKAAEDGTVAYAGSELKGYGNLVLIKHADGWVTAYAHNSELDVKKGDTVKRGQVIAKAGQTGSVTSPQVHFEIRKGSQPVDPSSHLAGL